LREASGERRLDLSDWGDFDMAIDINQRLERAILSGRQGLKAPAEDILVAGLVAAPFAGTFGIWLSWLTWWPNPVLWVATAIVLVALGLWIAGRGVGVAETQE
jgi:hypothetical protein